jgi:hypothetical protein
MLEKCPSVLEVSCCIVSLLQIKPFYIGGEGGEDNRDYPCYAGKWWCSSAGSGSYHSGGPN